MWIIVKQPALLIDILWILQYIILDWNQTVSNMHSYHHKVPPICLRFAALYKSVLVVFTAHRKAVYMLHCICKCCICYGKSVRLSVCPSGHHTPIRYCVKTRKCRGMRSSPSGSPVSLVFWCQEWFLGDDPVHVKSECKEVDPLWKQPSCTRFAS